MHNKEGLCSLIGSIVGAIVTGIAVYFTGSCWCALIGVLGYIIGSYIGRTIDNSSDVQIDKY